MRKKLLDNKRSILTSKEIARYRSEITKIKNGPVVQARETLEVADEGAHLIERDGYCLLEEKLDV